MGRYAPLSDATGGAGGYGGEGSKTLTHDGGGGGGAGISGPSPIDGGGPGGYGSNGVSLSGDGATLTNHGNIYGGNGGKGGQGGNTANGGNFGGNGGNGNGAGWGVELSGDGATLTNHGFIAGGTGGAGGNGGANDAFGGGGGAGGNGGWGVYLSGSGATLFNYGVINGGSGRDGGDPGPGGVRDGGSGRHGNGSGGVYVNGGTLINSGTISGGYGGFYDGGTADPITFGGSNNRLELWGGSVINGAVNANGGSSDTLALGGTVGGTFNVSQIGQQYQGFEAFEKTGSATWTLIGTTSAVTPWTINQGTLSISADASLGDASGALTLENGATLQNTAAFTTARSITLDAGGGTFQTDADLSVNGVISGSGALIQTGSGTLTLSGTNTYSGGTVLEGSTLAVSSDANLGDASGGLALNGGTLLNTAAFTTERSITLAGSGTFQTDADLTATGVISGSGALIQTGSGTLTLSGTNTYSGGTVLSGTLAVSSDANLGATSGALTLNGGTLQNTAAFTTARSITLDTGGGTFGTDADLTASGVISGIGALILDGSGTLTLAGTNTYSGGTVLNAGFLVVSSDANLGAATGGLTFDGGTLQTTAAFTTARSITLDAAGAFEIDADLTASGVISGSSELSVYGSGTLTLSGTNTYSGGTVLDAGTLAVSSDANLGDASGGLTFDGGTLQNTAAFTTARSITLEGNGGFETFADLGVNGVISGSGALIKSGSGTLTLSGANTYTGGTTIDAGFLAVSSDANLGATSGGLTFNDGTLQNTAAFTTERSITLDADWGVFQTDADLSVNGVISGSGTLIQTSNGSGTLTLSGANTYSGGTTISGGTLAVSSDGNLGDATGGLTLNGGTLQNTAAFTTARSINLAGSGTFQTDADLTATGVISGGGALILDGSGTLTLSGANTYGGSTVLNAGFLVVSSDANLGAATGGLTFDGGTLQNTAAFTTARSITLAGDGAFNTAADLTATGTISGAGALGKVGSGTLTLSGANTYSGGTVLDGGTLAVSSDGNLGAAKGGLFFNGGTLQNTAAFSTERSITVNDFGSTFQTDADLTVNGVISGGAGLTKTGSGTLTLAGTMSQSGSWSVDQGVLIVSGSIASSSILEVNTDGTVGGTGTVGSTTIESGGTIAPGTSIGTIGSLTVNDITFASGSIYQVEADPAGDDSDLINTIQATIDGGSVVLSNTGGSFAASTTYLIIASSGGVTGTFDGVTSDLAFLDATLGYDSNANLDVTLTLVRNDASFASVGETPNHFATAGAIESLGSGNAVHDAIVGQDAATARMAFDQLSGEIYASTKTALIEDSRLVRDAVTNRVRAAFGDASAPAMPVLSYGPDGAVAGTGGDTSRFTAWGSAFGSWGSIDGDGNAAGLDRSTGGFLVGGDALVGDAWRVGLFTGYSRSSFEVDDRASSGNSDNIHLGVYAGTQWGVLGLRLGAAYAWNDIETSRSVGFPGTADTLDASYPAGTMQLFGELGYRIDTQAATFEPFAGLAYVNVDSDGFAEDGGMAALTVDGGSTDTTFTTLGLRASTRFMLGRMQAKAHGMLGWRHAFSDVTPTSTNAFAGGAPFTVAGVPIAEDAAVLEAGLDFAVNEKASLGIAYSGQVASGAHDHGFKANLSVRF